MSTIIKETLPAQALREAYDLGDWVSVELLPAGKSQHHFLVTERGEYVVRRSYRGKSVGDIRLEHELMAHLRANGFPAPEVVPTVMGGTYISIEGRLFRITAFVRGEPYEAGNLRQLEEVAHGLAGYHGLARTFLPSVSARRQELLKDSLWKRLSVMPRPEEWSRHLGALRSAHPEAGELLEALPYALRKGEETLATLRRLYHNLPSLTIHAGCRRGSALFEGDRLRAMLDFDSAHTEVRALDLAVALHDYAKVYGDPDSPFFKVPLDFGVVAHFAAAYQGIAPLEPSEVEALPALLMAKRLKRALGRYDRLLEEQPLSRGDINKIRLEMTRVRWLDEHSADLRAAVAGAA